jgi:hypothetical protein
VHEEDLHLLRQTVSNLRKKIEPSLIVNHRGVGFSLLPSDEEPEDDQPGSSPA